MNVMHARQRRDILITNAVFASSILLPLLLPFTSLLFRIPEFSPQLVIYSRDLPPLLFAPWTYPSTVYRVFSRLLQSILLFRLPKGSILPCYLLWIAIALSRILIGFLLSRGIGWVYPSFFNHWALYESSGGCGPSLVAYFLVSGTYPDLSMLLTHLRGYRWEVTESLVLLGVSTLLTALDHAPWTYGIAIGLATLAITFRAIFAICCSPQPTTHSYPSPDSLPAFQQKRHSTSIRMALLLLVFVPLPTILLTFLTNPLTIQPRSSDGIPLLEILILSFPRPNDAPSSSDNHSILSQTIASYLPYASSSITLSVFTHAWLSAHPAFTDAQHRFKDSPVTFYADQDDHPDAHHGQYLHLAEAFRWVIERDTSSPEWVMLVEDDFPVCGKWGWHGILLVMRELQQRHSIPSPEMTKIWGGFVGTGGSGLILHRALLPILASTLRLHALASSQFVTRRPADIIIQDCLLGADPMCPTTPLSKNTAEAMWLVPRQPSMVITSRLVMDHIGARSSTALGRVYDSNKWRCGWRHPFHGRPEAIVVPV